MLIALCKHLFSIINPHRYHIFLTGILKNFLFQMGGKDKQQQIVSKSFFKVIFID